MIIFVTCGTSLKYHLKEREFNEDLKESEIPAIVDFIKNIEPTDKRCGAEINSINSICKNRNIDYSKFNMIVFLYSDTNDGEIIAKILRNYYKDKFSDIKCERLIGLKANVHEFPKGLRELVRKVSEYVRKYSTNECIINATGGFKAQISFAGLIGQVFKIPVYYQFEDFESVIQMPPQPINFDYNLWIGNFELFNTVDINGTLELSKNDEKIVKDNNLESLFDIVDDGGRKIFSFSYLGELMHLGFLNYLPKTDSFIKPPNRSVPINYDNDIIGKHIKDNCYEQKNYFIKMANAFQFITRIKTTSLTYECTGIEKISLDANTDTLKGVKNFGRNKIEFIIMTTAKKKEEQITAQISLTEFLKK